MKLKTVLLSSAAAFAVVGGAQAADLSVAEPVEYVKACEAFGAGFFYLPGSDTCLQITGNVEFDANFHNNAIVYGHTGTSFVAAVPIHSASWDFVTTGGVYFDAKSMTDVGVLEASVGFKGTYNGAGGNSVALDGAYLKLGGLKAGHFGSTFNPGASYVDDYGIANEIKSSLADSNHIELSFKASTLGFTLGIEDPRESFGSALPDSYSLPLITGNVTFGGTSWAGFLSAGYTQINSSTNNSGSSWGIDGELTFDIGTMDHLRINGSYGDNPFIGGGSYASTPVAAPSFGSNNGWSAFASFQHMFSNTFRTDWDFSYLKFAGPSSQPSVYAIGADLVWLPYAGFKAKVGVTYSKADSATTGAWAAQVALKRSW